MAKTVKVKEYKRTKPSTTPRKNPDKRKPGPKTVEVEEHRRSRSKK